MNNDRDLEEKHDGVVERGDEGEEQEHHCPAFRRLLKRAMGFVHCVSVHSERSGGCDGHSECRESEEEAKERGGSGPNAPPYLTLSFIFFVFLFFLFFVHNVDI